VEKRQDWKKKEGKSKGSPPIIEGWGVGQELLRAMLVRRKEKKKD